MVKFIFKFKHSSEISLANYFNNVECFAKAIETNRCIFETLIVNCGSLMMTESFSTKENAGKVAADLSQALKLTLLSLLDMRVKDPVHAYSSAKLLQILCENNRNSLTDIGSLKVSV